MTAATVAPTPPSRNSAANVIRTTPVLKVWSSVWVRSAAIGATLVAVRAGSSAAPTVTTRPMARARAMVLGASDTPPEGRSCPKALSTASAPAPRPSPVSRPRAEEMSPTTTDSRRMEPKTCLRVAPMQRSSAISLVR